MDRIAMSERVLMADAAKVELDFNEFMTEMRNHQIRAIQQPIRDVSEPLCGGIN